MLARRDWLPGRHDLVGGMGRSERMLRRSRADMAAGPKTARPAQFSAVRRVSGPFDTPVDVAGADWRNRDAPRGVADECRKLRRNLLKRLHLENDIHCLIWRCCPLGARTRLIPQDPLGLPSSVQSVNVDATAINKIVCA